MGQWSREDGRAVAQIGAEVKDGHPGKVGRVLNPKVGNGNGG